MEVLNMSTQTWSIGETFVADMTSMGHSLYVCFSMFFNVFDFGVVFPTKGNTKVKIIKHYPVIWGINN